MHKRNENKLLERKIHGILIRGSFYDRRLGERTSKLTRLDVLAKLKEHVRVCLVPDIEIGEVLHDSRGKGTLQR